MIESDSDECANIPWSSIILNKTYLNGASYIIGQGAYGIVVRGILVDKNRGIDVAIKVITRSLALSARQNYETEKKRAIKEAQLIYSAERRMKHKENILRTYGVVSGVVPDELTSALGIPKGEDAIGIVSKYEKGGSLDKFFLTQRAVLMPMKEKLQILVDIIAGLVEIHSLDIIHGDIKPANILLSDRGVAKLADFGLAYVRNENSDFNLAVSALRETSRIATGTPIYSAPEIFNAGDDEDADSHHYGGTSSGEVKAVIVRSSRSTDIYAFGILCWEFLSNSVPFSKVRSEFSLATKVCSGERPSLNLLPQDTPSAVIQLIRDCWDGDRARRPNAVEVLSILQHSLRVAELEEFDIFFSHAWANKPFLSHVYNILTTIGYRVWYDQDEMGWDLQASMKKGISKSKVMLVCFDALYQSRPNCMFELKEAAKLQSVKEYPIILLVLQPNLTDWISMECKELCQVDKKLYIDISKVASLPLGNGNDLTIETIDSLKNELQPLISLLQKVKCSPSSVLKSDEQSSGLVDLDLSTVPWNVGRKLHEAIQNNDVKVVAELASLWKSYSVLDAVDSNGSSPLAVSAELGRIECMKQLLAAEVALTKSNNAGYTPLHLALVSNRADCIDLLIEVYTKAGVIDIFDYAGKTALFYAVELNLPKVLTKLIAVGASLDAFDNITGKNALMAAVANDRLSCARIILNAIGYAQDIRKMRDKKGVALIDSITSQKMERLIIRHINACDGVPQDQWEAPRFDLIFIVMNGPNHHGYSWCEAISRAAITYTCPCVLFSIMSDYVEPGSGSTGFFALCCSTLVCCCCIPRGMLRRKIRELSNISESFPCEDYVWTACCTGISITQEWHQLKFTEQEFDAGPLPLLHNVPR